MSTTMTLAEIRTAVRQRSDTVNSIQFFPDIELNSYINQSYFELYDLLVQKYGDNYYVASPYSITADGTNYLYSLPADFYKMIGLDLVIAANISATVKPFNMSERNKFAAPTAQSLYGVTNIRYRLNGAKIWLNPIPAANLVFNLWYIPRLITLALDTDIVDGVSGWTEYIIVDACIKIMEKQEQESGLFVAQKNELIKRIESAAENRDAGSPKTVSDTQTADFINNDWLR